MHESSNQRYLTAKQAGEYLGGIAEHTLAQWRWRGNGPKYYKIGSRVRYRAEDLDNFVRTRSSTSES